jgi:hypothetical protein
VTRRTFVIAGGLALPAGAAVSFTEEMVQGDTAIRLIDTTQGGFLVGVRTKVKCDEILVTVFYRTTQDIGGIGPTRLFLSEESIAPCVGYDGYGATRKDFRMPRESVEFIRLAFFKETGTKQEFGREKV